MSNKSVQVLTSSSASPPSTFVTVTLGMTAVKRAAFTAMDTASNRFPPHSRICHQKVFLVNYHARNANHTSAALIKLFKKVLTS